MTFRFTLAPKLIASSLALVAVVAVVSFVVSSRAQRTEALADMKEKAAAFVELTDQAQEGMQALIESSPEVAQALLADPARVHAGWKAAEAAAKSAGLKFDITVPQTKGEHSLESDKEHGAYRAALYARLAEQVRKGGATLIDDIDKNTNTMHVQRAIKLSDACMNCHDAGKDGSRMHGAYEIMLPLAPVDHALAQAGMKIAFISLLIGAIGIAGTAFYIRRAVAAPLGAMAAAAHRIALGDVDQQITYASGDEIGELADSFRATIVYVKEVAAAAEGLAKGDTSVSLAPKSEHDVLSQNVGAVVTALGRMTGETKRLSQSAVAGQLATRADATQYQGAYREVVQGVNDTLDAVIGPLNVAANYVDRISHGDIPAKITDSYNGDFNEIKNNLNQCIDAVNLLVADADTLSSAAVEGKLATRADATRHQNDFRKIVEGVNKTLDAVIGPLNVAADYVDRISKGDIPPKIADSYNGDFNTIKNNLNQCIDAINRLIHDADTLVQAAVAGQLDTRADATAHAGSYRSIVEGVNATLDAVIGPLNVAADYVDRISKGDIPAKITDNYHGDFNTIKNNLNQCVDAVNLLVSDAAMLAVAAVEGKLQTRADATRHQNDFRKIVDGVNKTLDAVIGPLNVAANYVERISRGDVPAKITDNYNGDFNEIKNNLNQCIDAVNLLVSDAAMLAVAAVEGKLQTRADATRHQNDFRKIVDGVNKTLDAVIGPLNVAANYLDRISRGDIPAKITDNYNGDFNEIKNNLNQCIDAVNMLVSDTAMLAVAAVEGKLQTRADGTRHQNDFRKIVDGVNKTLDAVIGPLNVAANYVERISRGDVPAKITDNYNGDFNEIKNNLNQCIDAVKALVGDANMLSQAAVEGKLQTRADAVRHQNDFRKIVEGVNRTLDAVLEPINEASGVLNSIAQGDLTARVNGEYRGDHAAIKHNINKMGEDLRAAMGAIGRNAEALSGASHELTGVAQQMGAAAEETAAQANVVSAASEQVNKNTQTVATGTEEMSASIKEIAKNASEAARVAMNAVRIAETTNTTIGKLGDSSAEIGKVIKVITSIAQQTNLLALNATIEAARAGEAGKGFAVVANEVKELAKETARATEEIGRKIEAIQGDTAGAVEAIAEIGSVINQINDISNTIASAVEEQSVTTNEITRNVSEAAKGAGEIAANIQGVASAATTTSSGAMDTQRSAEDLSQMAAELQRLVGQFRV